MIGATRHPDRSVSDGQTRAWPLADGHLDCRGVRRRVDPRDIVPVSVRYPYGVAHLVDANPIRKTGDADLRGDWQRRNRMANRCQIAHDWILTQARPSRAP